MTMYDEALAAWEREKPVGADTNMKAGFIDGYVHAWWERRLREDEWMEMFAKTNMVANRMRFVLNNVDRRGDCLLAMQELDKHVDQIIEASDGIRRRMKQENI